ncbi:YhaN family protein [Bradyrhizobium sp. LMTR 3]|uniref:ATP-binding protein n=1 Tax=Bradyrhizobium sp. LMTR 3 TaxID=189873 RepID=UPI0008108EDD|nr:YhaN family protein [Bradyrhizobium sp. LMTR 3]OCK55431.1 hypothetical protein LMTR3_11495 [Bradyrhizobium sp. LMTR 3]
MRLRSLDLIRYGHFTGRTLAFPSGGPDFHIVYGENEAGKSTTMSAIEDLLFGIPGQSPRNFLHENAALRIGATLEHDTNTLAIRRRKGNKDTILGWDDLPLSTGDGTLGPLLGGIDRAFYCRMFCLDHERLRVGGRDIIQAKDDVGATLFAAGAGLSGLRGRLAAMQEEAEGLWASRKAGHRKYYQAEDRLKDADTALRQHTVTASKWQELKSAFDDARERCAGLEKDIESQVTELAKIARIRRVYRAVRRLAEIEREIAGLGGVAVLAASAASEFEKAASDNAAADVRIGAFGEQIAAIGVECAGLVIDDNLLQHGSEIERLYERRIQIASGKADLPKRRADLAASEEALKRLATELEWTAPTVEDLINRIPVRAKVSVVRGLLTERGSRFTAVGNARKAVEDALEKVEDIRIRIEAVGVAQDVSALAGVVKSIRALGDLDARLQAAERERRDADNLCRQQMALMNPVVADEESLRAIRIPANATVKAHRDAARELERRIHNHAAAIREAARMVENNRKAYLRLVSDEGIVSAAELTRLRELRDAGWSIIKRKHIENVAVPDADEQEFTKGASLLNAFEASIGHADGAADQRFENAQSTAEAMVLARQIAEQEDGLHAQKEELEVLTLERSGLTAAWVDMWTGVTDSPSNPDEMLEWLDARAVLLGQVVKRDAALRSSASLEQEIADARKQLVGILQDPAMAATAESLPLNGMLATAELRIRTQETIAQKRAELELEERKIKTDAERKAKALESAEKEQHEWERQWKEALAALNLLGEAAVETIQGQIEALEQMRDVAAKIADLQHERIGKIERDITAFENEVARLAASVATDLAGADADDVVIKMQARLNEAKQSQATLGEKKAAIKGLQKKLEDCDKSREAAQEIILKLQQAACVTLDALRAAIGQSDLLRGLKDEQASLHVTLEADGDGLGIEALVEECRNSDLDQAAAREQTLTQSLKDQRQRQLEAIQHRNDAARVFEALGGDAAAAKAASDRQAALADMRDAASQYTRVRSASLILQWAIERFRREKQAPLLKRAGELFSILTGGSFERLALEYDEKDVPHLAGVRRDGSAVGVSGLSEGAADQLFMALRVAAVEEYLAHAGPVPFIADDLFINYDDERAAAGFKVLRQLSEKTQVLFFTHHQHLIGVARTAFGGNVSTAVLDHHDDPLKNVA